MHCGLVLAVLGWPIFLATLYARPWARIALALTVAGFAAGGAAAWRSAARIEADLESSRTFPLDASPGVHRVEIPRMSEGPAEGVLRGGAGRPTRADLEKLRWSFPAAGEGKLFSGEPREKDDVLLFEGPWSGPLEYRVEPSTSDLLKGRVLVVRHSRMGVHLIRDHALLALQIVRTGLLAWAVVSAVLLVVLELRRRRRAPA